MPTARRTPTQAMPNAHTMRFPSLRQHLAALGMSFWILSLFTEPPGRTTRCGPAWRPTGDPLANRAVALGAGEGVLDRGAGRRRQVGAGVRLGQDDGDQEVVGDRASRRRRRQ